MSENKWGRLPKNIRSGVRQCGVAGMQHGNGDMELSIHYAQSMVRQKYESVLSMILLEIAIWFVGWLIRWWFSKGILTPAMEYQPDEPGYED